MGQLSSEIYKIFVKEWYISTNHIWTESPPSHGPAPRSPPAGARTAGPGPRPSDGAPVLKQLHREAAKIRSVSGPAASSALRRNLTGASRSDSPACSLHPTKSLRAFAGSPHFIQPGGQSPPGSGCRKSPGGLSQQPANVSIFKTLCVLKISRSAGQTPVQQSFADI